MTNLTPGLLIWAYSQGLFPMSEGRFSQELNWFDPEMRGVLPLSSVHVPRRLRRVIKTERYVVQSNSVFNEVIRACAAPTQNRRSTWINDQIISTYGELHKMGLAHSVECWHQGELVGGLYGVSLGAAFFGESMFSRMADASKVSLIHLVAHIRAAGYQLLDIQFHSKHLAQFGAIEINRDAYHSALSVALAGNAYFSSMAADVSGSEILQSIAHTS